MQDMGMTDKQFNAFLRMLIKDLKNANEQKEKEEIQKKISEIIENLQISLEN